MSVGAAGLCPQWKERAECWVHCKSRAPVLEAERGRASQRRGRGEGGHPHVSSYFSYYEMSAKCLLLRSRCVGGLRHSRAFTSSGPCTFVRIMNSFHELLKTNALKSSSACTFNLWNDRIYLDRRLIFVRMLCSYELNFASDGSDETLYVAGSYVGFIDFLKTKPVIRISLLRWSR